jgi:VRR-NUC domain
MAVNARRLLEMAMTEAELQDAVVDLAKLRGWLLYHTHDSRRSAGGFPDLVLVRGRVIFAELKSERGRVEALQRLWLHRLEAAGAECYLWRPSDWPTIDALLR